MADTRICESCKEEKPETEFTQLSSGKLVRRCKICVTTRRARLGAASLEGHLKRMASVIKHRAKKQGIECNLTYETLLEAWREQDGLCGISGVPLTHHPRNNTHQSKRVVTSPTNVSVDRINPSGPYTRENIMLVCTNVNLMRRNMTLDEFIMWCRMVAETSKKQWAGD